MTTRNANAIEFRPVDGNAATFIIARAADFAEAQSNDNEMVPAKYWQMIVDLDTTDESTDIRLLMRTPRQYSAALDSDEMAKALVGWRGQHLYTCKQHIANVEGLAKAVDVSHNMATKFFAAMTALKPEQIEDMRNARESFVVSVNSSEYAEIFREAWNCHDWSLA